MSVGFILTVRDQLVVMKCFIFKRHHIFIHSKRAALSKFASNTHDNKLIRLQTDVQTDTSGHSKRTATQRTLQAKFRNCKLSHWCCEAGWGSSLSVSSSFFYVWGTETSEHDVLITHPPPPPNSDFYNEQQDSRDVCMRLAYQMKLHIFKLPEWD